MEAFRQHFQHLPQYRIIVCRKCRFAVVPAQVIRHLHDHHPNISTSQREAIASIAVNVPGVAHSPEEVQYPNVEDAPVEGLPVFTNGFQCTISPSCQYVVRDRTRIQRHCREEHDWQNPRKRGRPSHSTIDLHAAETGWRSGQTCQQFFVVGQWKKYFPIQAMMERSQDNAHLSHAVQGKTFLTQLFTQFHEAKQRRKEEGGRHRFEANPWLEHTGWEQHIGGHKQTVQLSIQPVIPPKDRDGVAASPEASIVDADDADSEQALQEACSATIALIRHSFDVCRPEIVGRAVLEYVNRREAGEANSDRPFYGKQKVKTLQKYADRWVKILRYLWRTADKGKDERPDYRITQRQREALKCLKEVAHIAAYRTNTPEAGRASVTNTVPSRRQINRQQQRQQRETLIEASMSFWIAMFDHELKDRDFESGMLSGLAVLGLGTEHGGWMPAINYTPILAAIITTLRAIVVRQAWQRRVAAIRSNIQQGVPHDAARDRAPSVLEGVQDAVGRFMTLTAFGGKPTPLNRIFQQKTYGMKIRYTSKAEGQIGWEGDDTIVVRKIKFKMDDTRTLVHTLVSDVRQRLVKDLLLYHTTSTTSHEWRPPSMPRFELSTLADDHAVLDEGWSFIQHVQNQWEVDGKEWMGMRIFNDPDVRQRFIVEAPSMENIPRQGEDTIKWKEKAVHDYFRQIRRFKEELIVLVHMTAGAPARATELISIQRENGPSARSQRGVFIDNGMVVIVTDYHKGFSASQRFKIVHRYVPREVGELIVYYLWLIEPFVRILQGATQDQDLFGAWLWEPVPEAEWPAEQQEEEYEDEDSSDESRDGSVASRIAGEWNEWNNFDDIARDTVEQRQPPTKPQPTNSDGFWDTDRVRRVMRRETAKRIGVPIGTSDWRQAYPAIHREFAINDDIRATLKAIYEQKGAGEDESAAIPSMAAFRAKQSGHSQQMEENIYGVGLRDSPFTTIAERDAFRRVSVDWHRFLGFTSAWKEEGIDPDVRRRVKAEQDAGQIERFRRMREIDIHAELKKMYHDPNARFRGFQQPALEAIISGHPRIVVVMRTGGGKSLLFMLPAIASPHGVSIVVVPKKALQSDMEQRCRAAGIRTSRWVAGSTPPYDAQIVFVISESAITQSFTDFINSKKAMNQLDRIVIDECHAILQSTDQWRKEMRRLCELSQKGVQVVCLTATLPPKKQAQMLAAVDFGVEETQVLRDVTTRPNIVYSVQEYDHKDEVQVVQELVKQKKAEYPNGQIIVYCRSIKQTEDFARHLQCRAFHRTVGTDVEKEAIMEQLRTGQAQVFTSTNALGEGIDAPRVRVIIHIGTISSLDDYGQQSGRAGRDGRTASEAIILRKTWIDSNGQKKYEQGWGVEAEMKAFVEGKQCRRAVLDAYMDGRDARIMCESGEQRCDVCRRRGMKRVRVVLAEDIKRECRSKRGRIEDSRVQEEEVQEEEEEVQGEGLQEEETGGGFTEEWFTVEEEQMIIEAEIDAIEKAAEQQQAQIDAEERGRERQRERERREFKQQQQHFAAIEARQRAERVQQEHTLVRIEAQFEDWHQGCSICRIRQQPGSHSHQWRECPSGEDIHGVIKEIWRHLGQVKWKGVGVCCGRCWAPQAICHTYDAVDTGGPARFRQGRGSCQYPGVLREAAAAILATQGDAVAAWIIDQAKQSGTAPEGGDTDWDNIIRPWLGQVVYKGGVQMSGMCAMFHQFADVRIAVPVTSTPRDPMDSTIWSSSPPIVAAAAVTPMQAPPVPSRRSPALLFPPSSATASEWTPSSIGTPATTASTPFTIPSSPRPFRRPGLLTPQSSQSRVTAFSIAQERLRSVFRAWQGRCSICAVQKRAERHAHPWQECPFDERARERTREMWQWLGRIPFQRYTQCKHCWAPQGVCDSWRDVSQSGWPVYQRAGGEWQCQFMSVLRDGVAAQFAIHDQAVEAWLEQVSGVESLAGEGWEERSRKWLPCLGQKVKIEGIEASRLCEVFRAFQGGHS